MKTALYSRPLRPALLLLGLTAIAGCTPKLQEETPIADLFSKTELDGKLVTTAGVLRISTGIAATTSCTATRCTLDLWLPEEARKTGATNSMVVYVPVGSGENEMSELPDRYSKTDLKVKAMGGKVIGYDAKVKLTGKAHCKTGGEPRLPCSIDVERIDAL